MGKVIDRISPAFIEDQIAFARELLTHVNPHTGSSYAEDPAVVIVEINNENGLLMEADGAGPSLLAGLPGAPGADPRAVERLADGAVRPHRGTP